MDSFFGKLKNQESEKLFLEIKKVDLYKNPQKKAFICDRKNTKKLV